MMSFTNSGATEMITVEDDFACTIEGSGISVTAATCQEAHVRWKKQLESEKQ